MKKQLFALLGLGLLLSAASAYAQTMAYAHTINLKVNVPFNFVVTAETLPSGEYTIRSEPNVEHALSINAAGQKSRVFLATPSLSLKGMKASQQTKLVFTRYGDQYFLSEIWMAGNSVGQQLPKGGRELEMAQNNTFQQVVVLAEGH
ncbi:MAG TPA: hypothetical protein VEI26_01590 [Terriglobales bacterium]|nr:hypothetical protein [Terriglobales bacterium]